VRIVEVRGFEPRTPYMPCPSMWFSDVHSSPIRPILQGLWFMRVHRRSREFKIFAKASSNGYCNGPAMMAGSPRTANRYNAAVVALTA
jgi:hypothetical protein